MSIGKAMNTAASGLRAHGEAMGVTADNIANANTIGYKRSRSVFEDVLGQSIADTRGRGAMGSGSRLAAIEQVWTQGTLLTTESPTDLALSGDGFFVVEGNVDGVQGRFYTRAGQFKLDQDGYLVNAEGLRVVGYQADETGAVGTTLGPMQLTGSAVPPQATTQVDMALNLDADATVPPPWDPTDPGGTSNFSTTVTVYDSLGNPRDVTVYFRKSGANSWEWRAMVDGGEITGGVAGTPFEGASGTLTFTTDGALDTETVGASSWDFVGATPGQSIAFDFGTSITTDGGSGLDATTQFASPSTTNGLSQDGYAAGSVSAVSVASDGTITGVFDNGQRRVLARLAVADFTSVSGLSRAGHNLWVETEASGEALIGTAGTGGRGSIVAGALEQSNVDLSREFVDLISLQRGFQANSRVVTTSDEMLAELVNLKR